MSEFALFLYICGAFQMAMFISKNTKSPNYWYCLVWPITDIATLLDVLLTNLETYLKRIGILR